MKVSTGIISNLPRVIIVSIVICTCSDPNTYAFLPELRQLHNTYRLQCPAFVSIQAVSILHSRPRCIFKTFFYKVCSYIPKLQKIYKKIHHRFMVKNLEFQIYIEKILERPQLLFMKKRLYSTGLHIV